MVARRFLNDLVGSVLSRDGFMDIPDNRTRTIRPTGDSKQKHSERITIQRKRGRISRAEIGR